MDITTYIAVLAAKIVIIAPGAGTDSIPRNKL